MVGVTKSILCDISDDSNQAAGMSTIALAWGMGIILGPLISGTYSFRLYSSYDVFLSRHCFVCLGIILAGRLI